VTVLLSVTSHTPKSLAVCDCVTVHMSSVREQTLYSPYTPLLLCSEQPAIPPLHYDRWSVFRNSCTDNRSTRRHCYCHRTWKHKQFHYK